MSLLGKTVLLLAIIGCESLRTDIDARIPGLGRIDLAGAFGAIPGATVLLNVTVEPPSATVHVIIHGYEGRDLSDELARTGPAGAAAACSLPSLLRFEVGGRNGSFFLVGGIDRKVVLFPRAEWCEAESTSDSVKLKGTLTILNTALGQEYQHLSADDTGASAVYSYEAIVQGVIILCYVVWVALGAWLRKRKAARTSVGWDELDGAEALAGPSLYGTGLYSVHVLFIFTLVFRLCELLAFAGLYNEYSKYGRVITAPRAAGVMNMAANGLLAINLWAMASGWGYMRVSLTRRELAFVAGTGLVYAICCTLRGVCTLDATIDSPVPGKIACDEVEVAEFILRSIVLLGAIFALNFNLTKTRLELTYHDTTWAPGTAQKYVNESRLRVFRRVFMACLLLPPILFVARLSSFTWEFSWVNILLAETVNVSLYGVLATLFCPPWPGPWAGGLPAVKAGLEEARKAQTAAQEKEE